MSRARIDLGDRRALRRIAAGGALGALAALVIALLAGSDSGYRVQAVFDQSRGLIEGGEVKAGALNVGTVEDISFNEQGLPVVTMVVDDDYRIRRGAFADIRLASNVGAINRYVELSQGGGPELEDGATLGPGRTDQPVDLDLAFSTLDRSTRAEAAQLLAGVAAATNGRGDDLGRTLRHSTRALGETAAVLQQVNADEEAVRTLVGEGRRLVGALASQPDELGATAERLAQALTLTARRERELARTAAALGPGASAARDVLGRLRASIPNLRALVADAAPAVAELRPTTRVLVPAVEEMKPLIREVDRILRAAPRQLRTLNGVLSVANPLLRRMEPVLRGFGPVIDQLRVRAPEVIGFFTLFADATSNFDVNSNLIRSTAIPIQTARHPNLIDASSDAAGSVVRPFDRTPGAAEGEPWHNYWRSFIGGARRTEHFIEPEERSP